MSNKRYIFNDDVLIEDNGILRRNEKFKSLINPIEKNKHAEFIYIIEQKTNTKFNEEEWFVIDCIPQSLKAYCICSNPIENLYYIKHVPTDLTFLVGSKCISKISTKLYLDMKKSKCICGNLILDRRNKYGRLGYCSKTCVPLKLNFGKHKGKLITEVDKSYIKWLYGVENLYDDLRENIKLHYFNTSKI